MHPPSPAYPAALSSRHSNTQDSRSWSAGSRGNAENKTATTRARRRGSSKKKVKQKNQEIKELKKETDKLRVHARARTVTLRAQRENFTDVDPQGPSCTHVKMCEHVSDARTEWLL